MLDNKSYIFVGLFLLIANYPSLVDCCRSHPFYQNFPIGNSVYNAQQNQNGVVLAIVLGTVLPFIFICFILCLVAYCCFFKNRNKKGAKQQLPTFSSTSAGAPPSTIYSGGRPGYPTMSDRSTNYTNPNITASTKLPASPSDYTFAPTSTTQSFGPNTAQTIGYYYS